jgi:predicted aminopeptidase
MMVPMPRLQLLRRFLILIALPLLLSSCVELSYYLQCASGQLDIMRRSRPLPTVIADPQTPPEIRHKLQKVQAMRTFAVTNLGLPDNESYRRYADLGRPYAVWNLVAAPEFSLEPKQWCFPIAGCVNYKGYFKVESAHKLAAELRADNYDVSLYGVQAYSTLNWFADPILNTFIDSSETRLAGLLFHELAHQLIYVENDSPFNEAFAMSVQIEGVKRWFRQQADAEKWQRFQQGQRHRNRFYNFLGSTRQQLKTLYQRNLPPTAMRIAKQEIVGNALEHYRELRRSGQLDGRFDGWIQRGLNNARLAGIATYRELLPGFQVLLHQSEGNLELYFQRVRELAELSIEQRQDRLSKLAASAQPSQQDLAFSQRIP